MFVLLAALLIVAVNGDISNSSPKAGDCVCANTNVNARNKAGTSGTSVVTVIPSGSCGKIYGGVLTTDGYRWFEVTYGGQRVWVAGKYMNSASAASCSSQCSAEQKNLACQLMTKANANVLRLAKVHPSGVRDNAYSYNNMRDMCNGLKASRSSYSCNECPTGTPGGTVCLSTALLKYLKALADRGTVIVNELAGACHSCASRHYRGLAVDLHNDHRSREYMNTCVSMGGWALDEGNHIHCQF